MYMQYPQHTHFNIPFDHILYLHQRTALFKKKMFYDNCKLSGDVHGNDVYCGAVLCAAGNIVRRETLDLQSRWYDLRRHILCTSYIVLLDQFCPFNDIIVNDFKQTSTASYQPTLTFFLPFPIDTDNIQRCRRRDGKTDSLLAVVLTNLFLLAVGKFGNNFR